MSSSASHPPQPAAAPEIRIIGLGDLPEIGAGDDLATVLAPALAAAGVRDGDVLCVSTKIVSKARGLTVPPEQREAAVAAASVRTVARRRHTRVVTSVAQIPSGPVMAAAGVDSSNAPGGPLLLPEDPDACAEELREGLDAALGVQLGVLLTDTSSRIWRVGVGDIVLGAAGVASLQDLRGGVDADGRALSVTVRNLADEIAAAADLVKGKAAGIPAAIVRGAPGATDAPSVPGRALSRTGGEDWFRRPSLESVWVALGLTPQQEPIARMSPEPAAERISRALEVAALARPGRAPRTARARRVGDATIHVTPGGTEPSHWAEAGQLAERIRTALGAEAIAAALPEIRVEIVASAAAEPITSAQDSPTAEAAEDAATAEAAATAEHPEEDSR